MTAHTYFTTTRRNCDCLAQYFSNSSGSATNLLKSCIKPSTCSIWQVLVSWLSHVLGNTRRRYSCDAGFHWPRFGSSTNCKRPLVLILYTLFLILLLFVNSYICSSKLREHLLWNKTYYNRKNNIPCNDFLQYQIQPLIYVCDKKEIILYIYIIHVKVRCSPHQSR